MSTPEELEQTVEDLRKQKSPLVPATAGGAALVGVPLAAILSVLGYASQQLLALDEAVQRQAQTLESYEPRLRSLEEIAATAGTIRSATTATLEEVLKGLGRIEERQVNQLQRLSKVEGQLEYIKEEQQARRPLVYHKPAPVVEDKPEE